MRQTVIGIFNNENEAQTAVEQLVSDGFDRTNIDISEDYSSRNRAGTDYDRNDDDNDSFGDKISNFFSNLFGSDDDDNVKNYSTAAQRGCLVTVHAESQDEAERAVDILDLYGAVDLDENIETSGNYRSNVGDPTTSIPMTDVDESTRSYTGQLNDMATDVTTTGDVYTSSDRTTSDYDIDRSNVGDESTSVPIIEEELQVGKREVETGRVRLKSRIIERPVEETLRLRYERVNVERNPVNRPATEADFNQFEEGTIELTERAEIPVVNKEARVVEEVRLDKNVEERSETIRDTVRRTDVDVDRDDSDNTSDFRSNR